MAQAEDAGSVAPEIVERFLKRLNVTFKAVKLYPMSSSIPRENAAACLSVLKAMLQEHPVVGFTITKDGFVCDDVPVFPGHPAFTSFAREFYARNVAEVRFHAGLTEPELMKFLTVLDIPSDELAASGGFEAHLWDLEVNDVSVKEASTKVVDAPAGVEATLAAIEADGQPLPEDQEGVEDLIAGAMAKRPRDQRVLVRFAREPRRVRDYLADTAPGRGDLPTLGEFGDRLANLVRSVQSELPDERAALFRSISEALLDLDPAFVRRVLHTRILPEARHDESFSELVGQMGFGEVCTVLLYGMTDTSEGRDQLSRTLRNLIAVSRGKRDDIVSDIGEALRAAGAGEDMVAAVVEDAAPSRLKVRERRTTEAERPVETVLRLIDFAMSSAGGPLSPDGDQAFQKIVADAESGISDGDVMGSLVTLVILDQRPKQFASVMSMLENNLGLLVERQEFEVAADAAEALMAAEKLPRASETQRKRIRAAVETLARPSEMRALTQALRMYRSDSPEYAACKRLLSSLGEYTISSLLEVLADEQDMSARKSIVDMVSAMADRFIDDLGRRLDDPRWYFVRNVVSILGATHNAATLPHLERTLRHADVRVRRETIRALAGMRAALAHEMLTAALNDGDAANVQLAARFLGAERWRGAVDTLVKVARGEGRGNRDPQTRIEAIEALGRIGAPESVPVLEQLSRQRRILGDARLRELRTAAQAALAYMASGDGAVT